MAFDAGAMFSFTSAVTSSVHRTLWPAWAAGTLITRLRTETLRFVSHRIGAIRVPRVFRRKWRYRRWRGYKTEGSRTNRSVQRPGLGWPPAWDRVRISVARPDE